MLKSLSFLLIAILINNSSTSFGQAVTLLPKGTPAPFDGFLLPKDNATNIRKQLIEYDHQKDLIDVLNQELTLKQQQSDIKDKELTYLINQTSELSKQDMSIKEKSTWDFLLYFGLGVVATSIAIYSVERAR